MEERLGKVLNWLKLTFLVEDVTPELREFLLKKLKKMLGHEWDGLPASVESLKNAIGNKNYKSASGPVRNKIDKGDIENWDLTAVSHVLRSLNSEWVSDEEKERMEAAVHIRNDLSHHHSKNILKKEFDEKWEKLLQVLEFLNVTETRIAQIKENIKFRTSDSSSLFSPRVSNAEANKIIEEVGTAFRGAAYAQAIEKFDNALKVVSLTEADRGVLLCYRSAAFIQMAKEERYEREDFAKRAVDDAEEAARLHPVWIEAHWRLGDAYKLLENYKKAIEAYDEALSWDPSMKIITTRRDGCRQELGQSRKRKRMALQKNTRRGECRQEPGQNQKEEHNNCQQQKENMDTSDKHPLVIELKMDTLDEHPMSIDLMLEEVIQNRKEKITEELQEEFVGYLKKSGTEVGGTWYRFGIDVVVDFELAANFFSIAANEGNALGIYVLARLTQKGLGVKKDYRRAFQLFQKAAKMPPILNGLENEGVLPAMHCEAMMYYEGVGVELCPNKAQAFLRYKWAADLGFGPSAYNLGVMYFFREGVPERNIVKAAQYWKLAAQCYNAHAMLALASYYLWIQDAEQARKWFKFAGEGGQIQAMSIQQEFKAKCKAKKAKTSLDIADAEEWEQKENLPSSNLSDEDRMERFLYFDTRWRISVLSPKNYHNFYKHDTNTNNVAKEYALQGRVNAKLVLEAIEHYESAIRELCRYEESPDATIGDTIIREYALCNDTSARCVSGIMKEGHATLLTDIVKKKLFEVKDQNCEMDPEKVKMDRYARICFAKLQSNSEENLKFIEKCIRMYPKVPFFYEILVSVLNDHGHYDEGIKQAQEGLDLFPENFELMFGKAVMTKIAFKEKRAEHADMKNVIGCFEVFLKHAPADHRYVPEAYYYMAQITLEESLKKNIRPIDEAARAYYEKGLESEKLLLPCFLPYEELSVVKNLISAYFELTKKQGEEKMSFSLKSLHDTKGLKLDRLTDPVQVRAILWHRKFRCALSKLAPDEVLDYIPLRNVQCAPCDSDDLTPITISEMNPTVDKLYEGHIIDGTIIDDPAAQPAVGVAFVLEDTRGDVILGFSYSAEGDQRIKFGAKVSIQQPYLTTRANYRGPMILVGDPKSLIFHEVDSSERSCQSCGEKNVPIICPDCKKAAYCSEYCQTYDRNILQHNFICNL